MFYRICDGKQWNQWSLDRVTAPLVADVDSEYSSKWPKMAVKQQATEHLSVLMWEIPRNNQRKVGNKCVLLYYS